MKVIFVASLLTVLIGHLHRNVYNSRSSSCVAVNLGDHEQGPIRTLLIFMSPRVWYISRPRLFIVVSFA